MLNLHFRTVAQCQHFQFSSRIDKKGLVLGVGGSLNKSRSTPESFDFLHSQREKGFHDTVGAH